MREGGPAWESLLLQTPKALLCLALPQMSWLGRFKKKGTVEVREPGISEDAASAWVSKVSLLQSQLTLAQQLSPWSHPLQFQKHLYPAPGGSSSSSSSNNSSNSSSKLKADCHG